MRDFFSMLVGKPIDPNAKLELQFNQPVERVVIFGALLLAILFAIWIYRRDGKATASPLLRSVLGFFRAALIVIALFILAEPVLIATQIETRRSTVIVLVDDSYSMELKFVETPDDLKKKLSQAMAGATLNLTGEDGKPLTVEAQKLAPNQYKLLTRLDVVSAALQNKRPGGTPFLETLGKDHDVRLFGFSRGLSANYDDGKPIDPTRLKSSVARGAESRIGEALRAALREARGQPLAGVVIVSDGRQNAGEDALIAAQLYKTRRVPVYAVGVGDPTEPKDFEVTFTGPDMILPEDQSEGTAFVRFKGYTGITSIKVEMKDGERVVATEELKLGKPGEKTPVPLRFKEAKPGKYTYKISIPEQPGELRNDNNQVTYNFQVVDKKVKVLFVEGQDMPRWEYRYLKNALRRDHTTECDVLLATADGTFLWDGTEGKVPLEQFPINKKEISEYDVIIFGDVSPSIFTAEQAKLLQEFVREGGGFMAIAGERYMPSEYSSGIWFEMLPVIPQKTTYQVPDGGFVETFNVELTPEGMKQAWTHLDPDEHANREVWENLPRLYWHFPVKKKKELASVIAVHPTDKDESGAKMPLIVVMPYGNGRTMYLGVDSLWRWRRGVGDRYHYRFYNQAIRHLSMAKRLGGQKRFFLGADRTLAAIGDKITLNAILKDENLRDLTEPRVTVHGRKPNGENFTFDIGALRERPGNYEGGYNPEMVGDYLFWLKDPGQPEMHQSEVSVKVEKPQLEYEDPRLDEELLRSIAKAAGEGGEYRGIEDLNQIKIQPRMEQIPRETQLPLWDNWFVFALFTLLITMEWILRKVGRMI